MRQGQDELLPESPLQIEMGDSSFSLYKLRGVLAPFVDESVLNECFDDVPVGFIEQPPDFCN